MCSSTSTKPSLVDGLLVPLPPNCGEHKEASLALTPLVPAATDVVVGKIDAGAVTGAGFVVTIVGDGLLLTETPKVGDALHDTGC